MLTAAGRPTDLPVGRDTEIGRIMTACPAAAATGSFVLVHGAAGVGKTMLALEATRRLTGGDPLVVRGSPSTQHVPFGALTGLVGGSSTAAALNAIIERQDRTVIVLDDIPIVDRQSLAILLTSMVTRSVHLIATARSGVRMPAPIADLVHTGTAHTVHLGPLAASPIRALIERELKGPVDPGAVQSVLRRSSGNPLLALQLIEDARWRKTPRGWILEHIRPRPAITAFLGARLARLSARELAAVEMVALAEPLLVDAPDSLRTAAELGIVVLEERPEGAAARLAHPLYLDAIRSASSPPHHRRASAVAADLLLRRGRGNDAQGAPADATAFLRGVMLMIDGGRHVSTDDLVRAARHAELTMDASLALSLADRGLDEEPTHPELLEVRAAALAAMVAPETGEAFERARAAASDDEAALVRIATRHARFIAAAGNDPVGATSILGDAIELLPDGEGRDLLRFELLRWKLRSQLPDEPIDDPATAPAAMAVALLFRAHLALIQGRFQEIGPLAARGREIARATPIPVAFYEETLDALVAFGQFFSGDLRSTRDAAITRLTGPGSDHRDIVATWSHLAALSNLYAGRSVVAVDYAHEAVRATAWGDALALSTAARAVLAVALARCGRIAYAARTLRSVEPQTVTDPGVHLSLLEARTLIAQGRGASLDDLVDDCLSTAAFGLERGAVTMACMAAHLAVRAGAPAPRSLDILDTHATTCDGWYIPLLADHAHALAAGDAETLVECARRFEAGEFIPNAGEAFVQAMATDADGEVAIEARRGALRTGAIMLTEREHQVAEMAASGATSRSIGESIGLSRRTVENHLARIYRRLMISGRDELATIIGGAESGSAASPD